MFKVKQDKTKMFTKFITCYSVNKSNIQNILKGQTGYVWSVVDKFIRLHLRHIKRFHDV